MASITQLPLKPPAPLTDAYLRREYHLGVVYAKAHGGMLPQDNFWIYERARRSINPSRFDHFHPRFGWLLRLEPVAVVAPPSPGPVTVPVVVTPPGPPSAVSEPTSAALWALGLAAVLLAGRMRRRAVGRAAEERSG